MIELLTGLLFAAVAHKQGLSIWLPLRHWPFVAALVAIAFIDLEHRIIPDVLSWGGMGLGLATAWWDIGLAPAAMGAFIGFGVFYFFAWAYWKATGRNGLGGGDIKLLGMLGAFLGPYGVFTTILLSSILGSVFGLAWAMAARKNDLLKSSIPFGPFLVVGALYYYLLGEVLWLPFTIPT
jgi:leader peptidase (prepilin peptidase)/N-methyltransferase